VSRLETVDGTNWEEFVRAPVAVLMLGKTDCEACARWAEELSQFLESDREFEQVRFGKLQLDRPGLVSFKRANPWVAELDSLPFNVIYADENRVKSFAGGGVERLANRLRRILASRP
jgi:hypothetical protein